MMNRLFLTLVVVFSSLSVSAGGFGLGGIIHAPTGLSLNYYLHRQNSIDGAVSTGLNDNDQKFYIHSTYLWHHPALVKIGRANFDVFYGVGGRLIMWDENDPPGNKKSEHEDDTYIGPRGAIGAAHYFKRPRLQVFGELSLTVDIIPESDSDLDIAAGVRYYFE